MRLSPDWLPRTTCSGSTFPATAHPTGCVSIPWLRYVFPTRVIAEGAGLLALWAPLYNRVDPQLLDGPFFYWFQLLLVPVSALGLYGADRARRG